MLVAFASYPAMEKTIAFWQRCDVWTSFEKAKTVFVEPRRAAELKPIWEQYCLACNAGGGEAGRAGAAKGGAVLFAVARGKLTEGVDFTDRQCRLVAVCGLPLPPIYDRKVVKKREFLQQKQLFSPDEWYMQQGCRAVNQTIGRVIRHSKDFGAVLLCDIRFEKYRPQMSSWIRGAVRIEQKWAGAFKGIKQFYAQVERAISDDGMVVVDEQQLDSEAQREARRHQEILPQAGPVVDDEDQEGGERKEGVSSSTAALEQEETIGGRDGDAKPSSAAGGGPAAGASAGSAGMRATAIAKKPTKPKDPEQTGFRRKLEKTNWMELAKKLLDEFDFEELTQELLPALKQQLAVISAAAKNPDTASETDLATANDAYKEAIQSIKTLVCPAVCGDSERVLETRRRLLYNFAQFLHPRFRAFWREEGIKWIEEKRLAWAKGVLDS